MSMTMKQEPVTIYKVTGQWTREETRDSEWGRIGLNISDGETIEDFSINARVGKSTESVLWNAVGSRALDGAGLVRHTHLPVIELAGTADVARSGRRAALTPSSGNPYTEDSLLRDVLGDNGIELEVFERTTAAHSATGVVGSITGSKVMAIVLRSPREAEIFEVDQRGHDGGDNLYIQKEFGESDHQTLVEEMGKLGLVSIEWQSIAEKEGMGIVRTPWAHRENLSTAA